MKRLPFLAPLLLALPLLAADEPEKDSPQKIVADFKTEVNTMLKIFSIITDEKTATESVPAIEKSADAIVAVIKRMEKFPTPAADVLKEFGEFLNSSGKNIDSTFNTLAKTSPKAVEIVDKAMTKLASSPPPDAWRHAGRPAKEN